MGWVSLAIVGALAFAMLAWLRIGRTLWTFAGAALMLGAAGYALQGRPMQAGSYVAQHAAEVPDDDAVIDLRTQMFGRFGREGAYLTASDALARAGQKGAAVNVILGGLRGSPRSVMLWTSLGNALVVHDGNQVSPPALFAFRQAARLAPTDPAPPLFLGIAYVRTGDFTRGRTLWARALTLTPKDASYREGLAMRLAMLDGVMAADLTPMAPPAQ